MKWVKTYSSIRIEEKHFFPIYKKLTRGEAYDILLESGRGGSYSMFGLRPYALISGKGNKLTVTKEGNVTIKEGPLLESFKEEFATYDVSAIPDLPPFQGGAIGYISYDLGVEMKGIQRKTKDDIGLPELFFIIFSDVFIYDHEKESLTIIVQGERSDELHKRLNEYIRHCTEENESVIPIKRSRNIGSDKWDDSLTKAEFCEAVNKIKRYITDGDVYQVNISLRQTKKLTTDPFSVYEQLRTLNPSPYMAYVETPEFQLVSGSPELLIKKRGRDISARPIAGTIARGENTIEDAQLAEHLISNEKERAEHMMLVDVERNDIGKVSEYTSVEVDELMVIEKYSHVMHIVSNVKGTLAKGKDEFDIIRSKFPGGTITGAPKVRTMEIIEELERVRRGVYTGSIGWIGFNGDMELNVVIRTMICKDGYAHVQAGAGVVIDSDPIREYEESLKKAKALWRALELAEQKIEGAKR